MFSEFYFLSDQLSDSGHFAFAALLVSDSLFCSEPILPLKEEISELNVTSCL